MSHRVIEEGGEREREAILNLRRIVFKEEEVDKQSAEFWNWQFLKNPDGEGLIYLLKKGDQVVGHFADTPKRFVVDGKEVLGTLSVDMMVHPEHRGGMFFRLGQYAVDRTRSLGYAFLTCYPIRKQSIYCLQKIGWKGFFGLPVLVYPLRFSGILKRYLKLMPLAWLFGGMARILYTLGFKGRREDREKGVVIREMKEVDEAYDRFWEKASTLNPVMGVRDRRFITWRYLQHPTRAYTIYRAFREEKMEGYIILRKVDLLGFNSAVIVDLLAQDETVLKVLVDHSIDFGLTRGADLLGCIVPRPHRYYQVLREKGFIPSFKSFLFMVYAHATAINLSPEGWYVTWGDSDVI